MSGRPPAAPTAPEVPDTAPHLRIGEAAGLAGVSTRTLRYYQELGLLTPSGKTAGGARRYSEADVARIQRIRHLQDLVGLDLNEIRTVLTAEDRLAAIRREWFEDQTPGARPSCCGSASPSMPRSRPPCGPSWPASRSSWPDWRSGPSSTSSGATSSTPRRPSAWRPSPPPEPELTLPSQHRVTLAVDTGRLWQPPARRSTAR